MSIEYKYIYISNILFIKYEQLGAFFKLSNIFDTLFFI